MSSGLKFAKTHEWVKVDGNVAVIGISDFAVHALTDLVFIDLPKIGRALRAGEVFGVVESVKAASDLYAPVAGVVKEVNSGLEQDLAQLTADPFSAGWMVKIEITDPTPLTSLMDEATYKKFCESDGH
jgi:glycine cleavage system H protein